MQRGQRRDGSYGPTRIVIQVRTRLLCGSQFLVGNIAPRRDPRLLAQSKGRRFVSPRRVFSRSFKEGTLSYLLSLVCLASSPKRTPAS